MLTKSRQRNAAETEGRRANISRAFGESPTNSSNATNNQQVGQQTPQPPRERGSTGDATTPSPAPQVAGDQTSAESAAPAENDQLPPTQHQPRKTVSRKGHLSKDRRGPFIKNDGAVLKTNLGSIIIHFYNDDAPKTVNNFFKRCNDFYDGIRFHRVIKGS